MKAKERRRLDREVNEPPVLIDDVPEEIQREQEEKQWDKDLRRLRREKETNLLLS